METLFSKLRSLNCRALVIGAGMLLPGNLFAQSPPVEEDIRGPKAFVEIPEPEKFPYLMVGIIVGVLLLLALGWWLWKRQRSRQISASPREVAMKALGVLANEQEKLTAELFANQAAQTIRQYIADRFGLAAPRRTTEEFFEDLAREQTLALADRSDHLQVFLKSCDLAKFAGSNLDAKQRAELLETAREFIRATAETNTKPALAK